MIRKRVGALISGRGSNLAALIEAAGDPGYPAEIALVISNRADAQGLVRAAEARIATVVLDDKAFADRSTFDRALDRKMKDHSIDLVACAGFMRILGEDLIARWRDRMINIHPSLLPAYRGLNTHQRALADGVKIHGCSVHFVRCEVDAGPIIAQAAVPVLAHDTPNTLAARVLAAEHQIYPMALGLVASDRVRLEGERVTFSGGDEAQSPLIVPSLKPTRKHSCV